MFDILRPSPKISEQRFGISNFGIFSEGGLENILLGHDVRPYYVLLSQCDEKTLPKL